MPDARSLIAEYLRGQGNADASGAVGGADISRVLSAMQTNPDLVPGLRAMAPVVSAGDPGTPEFRGAQVAAPTRPRVSQPTQRAPLVNGAPPNFVGLPDVANAINYNSSLTDPANSTATSVPSAPPAATPAAPAAPAVPPAAPKPPDAPRVDDDPTNTGVAAKPFVPNQPPAPNAPGTQGPIDFYSSPPTSGSKDPIGLLPSFLQPTSHAVPPWLQTVTQGPLVRSLLDTMGHQQAVADAMPAFANQPIRDRIRGATNQTLGLVGGGVGARLAEGAPQMTRPIRTGPKPITSSVQDAATKAEPQMFGPRRSGVSEQPVESTPAEATAKELKERLNRLQIQRRIDEFNAGGGGGGTTSAPPRPTQAAPGRPNTPTAQAESPTTSNATPPINMGATPPPIEPVPLAEIIAQNRSPVNEILNGTRPPDLTQPVNPMPHVPTGEVVPVDIPQPTEPFRNTRYGGPIKHQQPPTPIRGEVTNGTNNAYNIPGTEQPITPTVAPVATGRAPTSVPPPVEVAAPGPTMQAPAPASPIDLATLLHEPVPTGSPTVAPMPQPAPVSQVPLPVNIPPTVGNVGGVREIAIGNRPMVEAVQRKIAGPKRELTRADVPAEETAGQSMARRLRERNKARR